MDAQEHSNIVQETIELPAPTAWPLVLALGVTLAIAGLVTNWGISVLGGVLIVAGSIGWFREVLPHEQHESVSVREVLVPLVTTRRSVARVYVHVSHRSRVPVETPSVLAGVKGGIAGGVAMILPALLYGQIRYHSIWYAVNLLGGAGVAGWSNPTFYEITHFRMSALIAATAIHIVTCLLVGLLYGAMLPVWPRHPIILGGLIGPLLWTGLLHSAIGLINPYLSDKIDWGWFLVSQLAFGLVAGLVVAKQANIRTAQYLPFAARAGLETPGILQHRDGEDEPQ